MLVTIVKCIVAFALGYLVTVGVYRWRANRLNKEVK